MAVSFNIRRAVVPNPRNENRFEDDYDPNRGMHGDAFPGASRDDRTGAGLMSRADEYRRASEHAQKQDYKQANPVGSRSSFVPSMIQSAPTDRRWDAFFQAMQEQGVSKLAADAVTPGGTPSFFGDQFGHSGASLPAGITHQRTVEELKKFQTSGGTEVPSWGKTPGGGHAQMTPGAARYTQNVLDGLRKGLPRYQFYGIR